MANALINAKIGQDYKLPAANKSGLSHPLHFPFSVFFFIKHGFDPSICCFLSFYIRFGQYNSCLQKKQVLKGPVF
jgi:hypothetical protein